MLRIANIVGFVACAVLIALAAALLVPRAFGCTPYAVLSGSMEPELPVGSLIYVKSVDPETIKPGDAVTFQKASGTVATHQAYEVDQEAQTIRTQGIANHDGEGNILHDAEPVSFSQVIGVPVLCVPYLGYVNAYVTTPPGVYVVAATVVLVALFTLVAGRMDARRETAESRP